MRYHPFVRTFDDYAASIENCAKKLHARPSKKKIHDLRIAIRHVDSIVWILQHSSCGAGVNELGERLKTLSRTLGQARELDVALTDAKSYHVNTTPLKKSRKELRRTIHHILSRNRRRHLMTKLTEASKAVHKTRNLAFREGTDCLLKKLKRWQRRRSLRSSDFHKLRKEVKRTRYVLEALGVRSRPLIHLQDVLGRIHDLQVLRNLTGSLTAIENDLNELRITANQCREAALTWAIQRLKSSI